MKTTRIIMISGILLALFAAANVAAHCEIPCGIYDDQLRAKLISEHITTIEKSMKNITALGKESPVNYNQMVRWVSNKETHADEVQHIVSQYFMTQRIKPVQKQYTEKLTVLHKMLLSAMKCKQTTDLSHVKALRSLLKEFEVLYFGQSSM
ncbi:superoxide dismutase [Ni] [Thermodesulfobacteriota bacterium]